MLTAFINEAVAIDMNSIVGRVLSRHTDELVALQQARLHRGERTDGEPLPLPYSSPYQKVRAKHGKGISIKDLDLTGGHYSGMYADVKKQFTEMGSNDWKEAILENNWGEEIYGLSDDDIDHILWGLGWAYEIIEEYKFELFN